MTLLQDQLDSLVRQYGLKELLTNLSAYCYQRSGSTDSQKDWGTASKWSSAGSVIYIANTNILQDVGGNTD